MTGKIHIFKAEKGRADLIQRGIENVTLPNQYIECTLLGKYTMAAILSEESYNLILANYDLIL